MAVCSYLRFVVTSKRDIDRDVRAKIEGRTKLVHDTVAPAGTVVMCRGKAESSGVERVSSVLACSRTQCPARLVQVRLYSATRVDAGLSRQGGAKQTFLLCCCVLW